MMVLIENNKICGIIVNGEKLNFDAVIVATGGKSYPQTGSSGDGYVFAKHAGHLVEELKPALNGVEIYGSECKTLEGLSLKNVCICAKNKGKVEFKSEIGEMLFTDVGISGPLVLTMSSFVNRKDIDEVCINFKPALSTAQIKDKIDKWGFDPKQLHHIIRLHLMLATLYETKHLTKDNFVFVPKNLQKTYIQAHKLGFKTLMREDNHLQVTYGDKVWAFMSDEDLTQYLPNHVEK